MTSAANRVNATTQTVKPPVVSSTTLQKISTFLMSSGLLGTACTLAVALPTILGLFSLIPAFVAICGGGIYFLSKKALLQECEILAQKAKNEIMQPEISQSTINRLTQVIHQNSHLLNEAELSNLIQLLSSLKGMSQLMSALRNRKQKGTLDASLLIIQRTRELLEIRQLLKDSHPALLAILEEGISEVSEICQEARELLQAAIAREPQAVNAQVRVLKTLSEAAKDVLSREEFDACVGLTNTAETRFQTVQVPTKHVPQYSMSSDNVDDLIANMSAAMSETRGAQQMETESQNREKMLEQRMQEHRTRIATSQKAKNEAVHKELAEFDTLIQTIRRPEARDPRTVESYQAETRNERLEITGTNPRPAVSRRPQTASQAVQRTQAISKPRTVQAPARPVTSKPPVAPQKPTRGVLSFLGDVANEFFSRSKK